MTKIPYFRFVCGKDHCIRGYQIGIYWKPRKDVMVGDEYYQHKFAVCWYGCIWISK